MKSNNVRLIRIKNYFLKLILHKFLIIIFCFFILIEISWANKVCSQETITEIQHELKTLQENDIVGIDDLILQARKSNTDKINESLEKYKNEYGDYPLIFDLNKSEMTDWRFIRIASNGRWEIEIIQNGKRVQETIPEGTYNFAVRARPKFVESTNENKAKIYTVPRNYPEQEPVVNLKKWVFLIKIIF